MTKNKTKPQLNRTIKISMDTLYILMGAKAKFKLKTYDSVISKSVKGYKGEKPNGI